MPKPTAAPRPRGRRPAGEDTRGALIEAARIEFTERGYTSATVRRIAQRAGVDAAMVNHWFGGKDRLFTEAVLNIPFNPAELIGEMLDGDPERLGERIVRTFLTRWDETGGGQFAALIRSAAGHDAAMAMFREYLVSAVFSQVETMMAADNRPLRLTLFASQMIGMGMVRYVARFEPLASADVETLARAIAPNLQRYLTGDLSGC